MTDDTPTWLPLLIPLYGSALQSAKHIRLHITPEEARKGHPFTLSATVPLGLSRKPASHLLHLDPEAIAALPLLPVINGHLILQSGSRRVLNLAAAGRHPVDSQAWQTFSRDIHHELKRHPFYEGFYQTLRHLTSLYVSEQVGRGTPQQQAVRNTLLLPVSPRALDGRIVKKMAALHDLESGRRYWLHTTVEEHGQMPSELWVTADDNIILPVNFRKTQRDNLFKHIRRHERLLTSTTVKVSIHLGESGTHIDGQEYQAEPKFLVRTITDALKAEPRMQTVFKHLGATMRYAGHHCVPFTAP